MGTQRAPQTDRETKRPHPDYGVVALGILGLLIIVRLALAPPMPSSAPAKAPDIASVDHTPSHSPPTEPTPTPVIITTPSPTPSRTPIPTSTPVPLRLAVEQKVYTSYRTFFEGLEHRIEGIAVLPYPRHAAIDDALALDTSDATLHYATMPPPNSVLLRSEPYAVIVHPRSKRTSISMNTLTAIALGQDRSLELVQVTEGLSFLPSLLDVATWPEDLESAETWSAAMHYVATHMGAIAIVPWEAVDFSVRTLMVDGLALDPSGESTYPLHRRLWLRNPGALPDEIASTLQQALRYQSSPTVELVAVGDIMLGRLVKDYIDKNSVTYPFEGEGIEPILTAADIAFGNLECPISDRGVREDKGYEFRADPETIEGLTYAGFDVLSLANNHTGDYGDVALTDTLTLLSEADIVTVGAGRTITEAHEVQVVEVNGLRLGFLAYNQIGPYWFEAQNDSPGSAFMDRERMIEDVQRARERSDVVIVSCHWGVEYTPYRNNSQHDYAMALSEAGASLVLGHHPHVVQGIEYARDTLVLYSLGNFVFDQGKPRATAEGVIVRCVLDASGVKTYELLPTLTMRCQPYLLSPDESATVLARIDRVTHERSGYRQ